LRTVRLNRDTLYKDLQLTQCISTTLCAQSTNDKMGSGGSKLSLNLYRLNVISITTSCTKLLVPHDAFLVFIEVFTQEHKLLERSTFWKCVNWTIRWFISLKKLTGLSCLSILNLSFIMFITQCFISFCYPKNCSNCSFDKSEMFQKYMWQIYNLLFDFTFVMVGVFWMEEIQNSDLCISCLYADTHDTIWAHGK
jgi:hypothetical protein